MTILISFFLVFMILFSLMPIAFLLTNVAIKIGDKIYEWLVEMTKSITRL